MAIHAGAAIILPAGSEVSTADPNLPPSISPRNRMIEVEWGGKVVTLFEVDLLERGERVFGWEA